ncbi:MCE family protein [Actinophytocola oryzae]|uniref:Phospholipid/cholesterol/gamma-HCH transport system substrate-binding protein n=1 Tax=Actinophytocola oryzae TaxID=502181 RepID=A0A4R7VSY8_9PSEU|nr:MCE family protein [Actinophytocola oryzae]TDV52327.1 phospholipid/cholesterol/gamma-HCH transport system substrate-binding protein [Actinophytocola oryzae]
MKRLKDRDQAAVGAVTLVLVVLGLLVAFNSDDLPIIGGGTTYTAEFRESAGLRPGNEVRLAGVKVGAVRSVELARNKVVVDFRVKDVSMGDRSTVSIEIKTLLGDKYLAVSSAGSQPQSANTAIPVSRTRTPFDIVPAVGKLSQTVDQIDTTQLAQGFQVLSDTFANSPQHIRDTLTGLSQISSVLSTRDEQLRTLLANTAGFSQTLADRDEQLKKLFSDASLLLGELQFRREAVHALLTGTTSLANELHGLVADNQELLRPTLDDLDKVTTILSDNQENLSKSLHSLAPYVRMFNNVVGNGRWFEGYICGLLPPTTDLGIFDINPQGCEPPLAYTGGGR